MHAIMSAAQIISILKEAEFISTKHHAWCDTHRPSMQNSYDERFDGIPPALIRKQLEQQAQTVFPRTLNTLI